MLLPRESLHALPGVAVLVLQGGRQAGIMEPLKEAVQLARADVVRQLKAAHTDLGGRVQPVRAPGRCEY